MAELPVCPICGSKNSFLLFTSKTPLSVTSDLRVCSAPVRVFQCKRCGHVFKNPELIKKEVEKIYEEYQLFEQGDERDQAIFVSGGAKSRSQVLVQVLSSIVNLPREGKFLDIGCNKGILLREFSKAFKYWKVYGYEISDEYEKYLSKIPRFQKFYSGKITDVKEKFDLITLVHTLEHIPNPVNFLQLTKRLLAPDGVLVVDVPNYGQNAFDTLIFEHYSHFFPETLGQAFVNAGLTVRAKTLERVPKEIILVGKKASKGFKGNIDFGSALIVQAKENIKVIRNFEKMLMELKGRHNLVVFGTAVVGTWCAGLLENKFKFFVDESPWRVGKKHLGKHIKHPKVIKSNDKVILAMAPVLAGKVYSKWKHKKASFWYPNKLN